MQRRRMTPEMRAAEEVAAAAAEAEEERLPAHERQEREEHWRSYHRVTDAELTGIDPGDLPLMFIRRDPPMRVWRYYWARRWSWYFHQLAYAVPRRIIRRWLNLPSIPPSSDDIEFFGRNPHLDGVFKKKYGRGSAAKHLAALGYGLT